MLVAGERRKNTVAEIFVGLREAHRDITVGVSMVTLVELSHGIERARLDAHRTSRQSFIADLIADARIYPITAEIAQLVGRISGQQALRGVVIPSRTSRHSTL